jgi:hypothetical protein
MDKKQSIDFGFYIIVGILVMALFKNIDFGDMTVKKPYLSAIYFCTLLVAVYIIVKNKKNKTE